MNPPHPNSGEKPFSENVSEIKRKRGRPAKYPKESYNAFKQLPPKTARGIQNYFHMCHAAAILRSYGTLFSYLLQPPFRKTILAEIGRLKHEQLVLTAAKEICGQKMKTAQAAALCRRMRGTASLPLVALTNQIQRTIDNYRKYNPATSDYDVIMALGSVATSVFGTRKENSSSQPVPLNNPSLFNLP